MDNKVKFLRGTAIEYEASTKDNDTFYYTTDDEKLYLGNKEITGGGVTIDDALSDTSKNPVQNKVINAVLNSKAEMSDIPTTLPANGGNSDTVDGKHASDFMQNLGTLTTGSLLDYVLTMTNSGYLFVRSGVTDTPVSGQFFFVDVRRDAGGSYAITATRFNAGGVWTNRYNSVMAKWYGWANVADGGNADTLDGKHASDFMQNLGTLTTGSLLDYVLTMTNSGYLFVRSGVTDTPVSGQFFFVDVRRDAGGSYAITATRFNAGGVWTNRYNSVMAKWYGWANVADGGNASTANTASTLATTSSNICLRNLSSGTAEATWDTATSTGNCPVGAWYGKHS